MTDKIAYAPWPSPPMGVDVPETVVTNGREMIGGPIDSADIALINDVSRVITSDDGWSVTFDHARTSPLNGKLSFDHSLSALSAVGPTPAAPPFADAHVMVDLETLGTTPGSVIQSIGACVFDPKSGTIGETFYTNVHVGSCLAAGLTTDRATVEWWGEQSQAARDALRVDPAEVVDALYLFNDFWTRVGGHYFWSHGPSFDEAILSAAYRQTGVPVPWHFANARCTRTIYDLAGVWANRDVGVHHNALDDARNQAVAVCDAYAKLGLSDRLPPLTPAALAWTYPGIPAPAEIRELCHAVFQANVAAGWWTDLATGEPLKRNVGELLMLVVSEISEAVIGIEGDLFDDKLPLRKMFEVELADTAIRIYDIAGAHNLDIAGAVSELLFFDLVDAADGLTLFELLGIVGEVSRAMEGHRKNIADEALPQRPAFEVGLAAALVRIYRLAHVTHFDLPTTIAEKRAFNRNRADHKPENRRADGGKAY